jgi:hypothetical protein
VLLIAFNSSCSPKHLYASVPVGGNEAPAMHVMQVLLAEYLPRGASVAVHIPIRCGGGLVTNRGTGHDHRRSLLSDPKNPLEIRWPLQPK